jgi:tetratricopeptide (TPR) repeat protein
MNFYIKNNAFYAFHLILMLFHLAIATAQLDSDQKPDPDQIIEAAIRHQSIGLAYLEESQPSKAIKEFEALVELAPDEAIGYGNLAVANLRLKKDDEAERWVKRGIEVVPMDSQLRFILAEVYKWQSRAEEAVVELIEAVKLAPDDLETRYELVRHYLAQRNDLEATDQAITHLRALRQRSPANVVVLLSLAQALLKHEQLAGGEQFAEAQQICTELGALLWDADEQFLAFLNQGMQLIAQGDAKAAARQIRIFNNVQKNTPRYQQGIGELVTQILGHPIETFSSGFKARIRAKVSEPIDVRFVDVSEAVIGTIEGSGKPTQVFVVDIDNTGDLELFTLFAPNSRSDKPVSLNEDGKPVLVSGLFTLGKYGDAAAFADIDKDLDQDWVILTKKTETVLQGDEDRLTDGPTKIQPSNEFGAELLFVDYDHDGDLDKIFVTDSEIEAHRNNADGTFTDVTHQTFLPNTPSTGIDAALGDFDDDGDIDLFVVNAKVGCTLYDNLRQGRMRAMTDETGIPQDQPFSAVAVGDYDNDGALDLYLTPTGGIKVDRLYRNRGDGTFVRDDRSNAAMEPTGGIHASDVHFLDYDNDGFLDLWIIGKRYGFSTRGDMSEILLFRNDGTGKFANVSELLPDTLTEGVDGAVGDYDNDGDLDLFIVDDEGQVIALRNDGGNQNGWLQVRLEGVTAGNNKVNIDGIASKIEVKAGDLYQVKCVTEPLSHFGLGAVERADVLRVVWTNGVPQNVILPDANQRIVEKQILKGSCPFLYVYDGERYQFVTDLLWRSPLGMTTSIGSIAPFETKDYVKIPGLMMKPKGGVYSLQLTEELWETAYFDAVELIAVDHPEGTEIFVDERMTLPPTPEFKIYTAETIRHPRTAYDHRGNDVSDALTKTDYHYAVEHEPGKYQGVVEPHFIVLDLGDVWDGTLTQDAPTITLFLTGWIFPTDTSINISLVQNPSIRQTFPYAQVRDEDGEWQTVIDVIGLPAGKNKTIAIDLTGKFITDDYHVKIATDMQIYWDATFFTVGEQDVPVQVTNLPPAQAELHYRGFSEMYRPTPHAPHLFDYEKVTTDGQWRDMAGHYTRYGDVTPLLQDVDDMYVIMNAGDEIAVEFDAEALPQLQTGWVRDFILFSDGWDKDADINTLTSQTVGPLPFHGMSKYPYPQTERYPNDSEHLRYRLNYNTRRVKHKLPKL